MMRHVAIFSVASGHALRTLNVPTDAVDANVGEGETAFDLTEDMGDLSLWRLVDGELVMCEAEPDPVADWMNIKIGLDATLAGGFPSQYGPVDLRPGAKQVMMMAVALGQGIDLILLDNSIVTLTAPELSDLMNAAFAWEQAQIMATQELRPHHNPKENPEDGD
jgi:hypothetical protein